MSTHRYVVTLDGEKKDVTLSADGDRWALTVDGVTHTVEQTVIERDEIFSLIIGDQSYMVDLVEKNWDSGQFTVSTLAATAEIIVRDELEAFAEEMNRSASTEGLFELKSPMPGIVVKTMIKAGDRVEQGQSLVILEAMKMQNELSSEMEGIVQEVYVKDGQMVETNAALVRIIREDA